jgi:hypothetical protein
LTDNFFVGIGPARADFLHVIVVFERLSVGPIMEAILPGTMSVSELKEELTKRKLPGTGKKGELIDRLVGNMIDGQNVRNFH